MKSKQIIAFLIISSPVFGQLRVSDDFIIGIYSYEYDNMNNANSRSNHENVASVAGVDPTVGFDYDYLREFKESSINTLITTNLLDPLGYSNPYDIYVSDQYSLKFLDRMRKFDIKCIVQTPEQFKRRETPPYSYSAQSDQDALNYYGFHPSVRGFHYSDEPESLMFPVLGQYQSSLKAFDNNKLFFVNLLPQYGNMEQLFGPPYSANSWPTDNDYQTYITQYISQVSPDIVFYDNYPIINKKTKSYYQNAYNVATVCKQFDIPFAPVLCTWSLYYKTPKSYDEFAHVIHSQLAYGGKGIVYWLREGSYTNPISNGQPWDNIANSDKTKLTQLHNDLYNHRYVLNDLNWVNSYHYSDVCVYNNTGTQTIPSDNSWSNQLQNQELSSIFPYLSNGLSGVFQPLNGSMDWFFYSHLTDSRRNVYLYMVNKNPYNSLSINVYFRHNVSLVDIFKDEKTTCYNSSPWTLNLTPGEGRLIQVYKPVSNSHSTCSTISGNRHDVVANQILIGSTSCSVVFDNAFVSYKGDVIDITNTFIESNSTVHFIGLKNNDGGSNKKEEANHTIQVYPNPTSGYVQVTTKEPILAIWVHNSSAQEVLIVNDVNNLNCTIQTQNLPSGIYTVTVLTAENNKYVEQILVL